MSLKRFLAATLGAVMLLSSVVMANPAPTHLQGTGTVVNPVFAVLLPAAPAVRINPLQIGSTATVAAPQVSSPWYVIANRSNVPVQVHMRVAPHTANVGTPPAPAATFVADADALTAATNTADTAADRVAVLELRVARAIPSSATFTNASTAVQMTDAAIEWASYADAHVALITPGEGALAAMTGGHQVSFLLGAHEYTFNAATGASTIVAGNMDNVQFTAFTFGGLVNPQATWAANQVTARVVFTITGISPVNFAAIVADADATAEMHRTFTGIDLSVTPSP